MNTPLLIDFTGDSPYQYTADLLCLQASVNPSPSPLPLHLTQIVTPLKLEAWRMCMQHHPDQQFAQYIITGIAQGFHIGFQYTSHAYISAKSNRPSANEHPDIISSNLETEIAKGRLLGPLHPSTHSFIHTSSLGAIPKKHSDKWRLILDPTQCITVLMMALTSPCVPLPI